jgi:hypothetical protein
VPRYGIIEKQTPAHRRIPYAAVSLSLPERDAFPSGTLPGAKFYFVDPCGNSLYNRLWVKHLHSVLEQSSFFEKGESTAVGQEAYQSSPQYRIFFPSTAVKPNTDYHSPEKVRHFTAVSAVFSHSPVQKCP